MKSRKLYEDILGIVILPFVGIALLTGLTLFLIIGWIPGLIGVVTRRYAESDTMIKYGGYGVVVSFIWAAAVLGEPGDAKEIYKEVFKK